jgi:hypothetical protein
MDFGGGQLDVSRSYQNSLELRIFSDKRVEEAIGTEVSSGIEKGTFRSIDELFPIASGECGQFIDARSRRNRRG